MLFYFFVFGILGLQLFQGALHNRCVPECEPAGTCHRTKMPLRSNERLTAEQLATYPLHDEQLCSIDGGGCAPVLPMFGSASWHRSERGRINSFCRDACAEGFVCARSGAEGEFPNAAVVRGVLSFDNLPSAFLAVFQCMTLEGWTDLMYALERAVSPGWSITYFVLLVFIGSFFIVQLALAVISDAFSNASEEETIRNAKKSARPSHGETLTKSASRRVKDWLERLLLVVEQPDSVRRARNAIRRWIQHETFANVTMFLIVINSMSLAVEFFSFDSFLESVCDQMPCCDRLAVSTRIAECTAAGSAECSAYGMYRSEMQTCLRQMLVSANATEGSLPSQFAFFDNVCDKAHCRLGFCGCPAMPHQLRFSITVVNQVCC